MSFLQFFDFIPLSSVSNIFLASAQKRCYRKLFRSITKELSEKTQVLRRQIKPFIPKTSIGCQILKGQTVSL